MKGDVAGEPVGETCGEAGGDCLKMSGLASI